MQDKVSAPHFELYTANTYGTINNTG